MNAVTNECKKIMVTYIESDTKQVILKERYIFKRAYAIGQSFMRNSKNWLVVNSHLIDCEYTVYVKMVDEPCYES